jgi:hypothetical protein
MDMEKNATSPVDREKNKLFGFGGSEAKKITRSNNPPTKVTIFWPRDESEWVTGERYYAGTSCWAQEEGKTAETMARHYQGNHGYAIERTKRSSTGQKEVAQDDGGKGSEQGTHKCTMKTGEGNGKPLLESKFCFENPV